jgi:hypothetical protein
MSRSTAHDPRVVGISGREKSAGHSGTSLFFFNQKEKRCNEAVEEGEEPSL